MASMTAARSSRSSFTRAEGLMPSGVPSPARRASRRAAIPFSSSRIFVSSSPFAWRVRKSSSWAARFAATPSFSFSHSFTLSLSAVSFLISRTISFSCFISITVVSSWELRSRTRWSISSASKSFRSFLSRSTLMFWFLINSVILFSSSTMTSRSRAFSRKVSLHAMSSARTSLILTSCSVRCPLYFSTSSLISITFFSPASIASLIFAVRSVWPLSLGSAMG
mmetsp:Transcript_48670/g.114940  ORF Transcript_48670/g.114940 Transcript_48670/m.114940 type:complete len:223 (-) Transcript_48670:265-933(-)